MAIVMCHVQWLVNFMCPFTATVCLFVCLLACLFVYFLFCVLLLLGCVGFFCFFVFFWLVCVRSYVCALIKVPDLL